MSLKVGERKTVHIRISEAAFEKIAAYAKKDHRSVQKQIVFFLEPVLVEAGIIEKGELS